MWKQDILGTVTRQTACGSIRGNERANCLEFLGVPYAHAARFAYAEPAESWGGTLDATKPGPGCPQNRAVHEHLEHPTRRFYKKEYREGLDFSYSEDCLNLNIFMPKNAVRCPVILFFHGGGFDSGLNCESPFDGSGLASRGIVAVFANYRIGPLGYFTHEELQHRHGRDGNFGLDDQLTAIRWVRAHIGDFGGDGENLTLLGQSAGAISIQYLCLNGANAGLFQRAAMMSGAGLFPRFSLPKPAADTHAYWLDFMEEAGCTSLKELESAPLTAIFDAMERLHAKRKDNIYNTMPVIDGCLIPAPIEVLMKAPLKLDYLISFTNNDMYAPVMAFIGQRYARETNAYTAYFDLDSPGDHNAAFHSADLRYVFETLDSSWRPYGKRDYEAARQIADYLANFARSGDPNGPGLPNWKRGGGRVLRIAPERTAMALVNYLKLTRNMLTKGDPKDEV